MPAVSALGSGAEVLMLSFHPDSREFQLFSTIDMICLCEKATVLPALLSQNARGCLLLLSKERQKCVVFSRNEWGAVICLLINEGQQTVDARSDCRQPTGR
jgi:hypothetical protein